MSNYYPKRVLIAGAKGLVGSAIARKLSGETELVVYSPSRDELDLRSENKVDKYLKEVRPDTVILAAARVGGIRANMEQPVDFLVDNLAIQNSVMLASCANGVKNLMFLGSSCIYPRECSQPIREDYFMTGPLEPTNESYAVAKIAGIRLARALQEKNGIRIFLPMPTNVYGPGDSFDPNKSHVLSALVRKFVLAVKNEQQGVQVWGSGMARREFIHSDDLATACTFLLFSEEDYGLINVGSGVDYSIRELALKIADLVGFTGEIQWDRSMPDGMMQKLLDSTKIRSAGWAPKIDIETGLRQTIQIFQESIA